MSLREEQCNKVCRILDDVLANRPTERDSLIVAVRKAFEAEPHWIPVTERLPKSKEEDLEYPTVLICFENEEIMLGCFYESTKEWGTGEYFDKKCNPIAWMPLPEPYKGVT